MSSSSIEKRYAAIDRMYEEARRKGLDVTKDKINTHYKWFERWYYGHIMTGHLMNRTGVRMKPRVTLNGRSGIMTTSVALMFDTTGTDAANIPANASHVGGYTTGTDGVEWSEADWARFPNAKCLRIEQGYGPEPVPGSYHCLDIENGAWTPQSAANEVKRNVEAGFIWTLLYGGDANLEATAAAIQKLGNDIWNGHVMAWLANWDLDMASASALIGGKIHGMTTWGAQWASPTSNPTTVVPGTGKTLKAANLDLSAVNATLWPWGEKTSTPAPPAPPKVTTLDGVLVALPGGATKTVHSTDNGDTWK